MYHLLHGRVTYNPIEGEEKFTISQNDYDYGIYSKTFSFSVFVSRNSCIVIVMCVIETWSLLHSTKCIITERNEYEFITDQEIKIHHIFQELVSFTTTYIKVHWEFSAVWSFKMQFFPYIHSLLLLDYETPENMCTLTSQANEGYHSKVSKICHLMCICCTVHAFLFFFWGGGVL